MLTAKTLSEAAKVVSASAEINRKASPIHANALDIVAADLKAEAQACDGYGTRATLALAIVIDNDRDLATRRREIIAAHAPDLSQITPNIDPTTGLDYETLAREIGEAYNLAASHAADALCAWIEDEAGMEGLYFNSDSPARLRGLTIGLPDVALGLLRSAITAVDWIGLARHYMDEDHRPRFAIRGSDASGWDVWDTIDADVVDGHTAYDFAEDAQNAANFLNVQTPARA